MVGFPKALCLGLAIYALIGCGKTPHAPVAAGGKSPAPAETLSGVVDKYWDEHIALEDVIATQTLADALAIERRYLSQISAVPREPLDTEGKLTWDLFKRQRELAVQGFTYPEELLPLRPFGGPPMTLAAAAAETAQHSLGAADYERWLRRVDGCSAWIDQAIANLREGVRRGYTMPRAVVERMQPLLARLGRDNADNIFYTPLRSMAGSLSPQDRERITREFNAATTARLLPAIRRLREFLNQEYAPKARAGLSLSELPLGAAWYAYRLRRATGADTAPAELNRLGMSEAERLKARMPAGESPVRAAAELLSAYQQLPELIAPKLETLFDPVEAPALEFVASDIALEAAAPLTYRPAEPRERLAGALFIDAPGMNGRLSAPAFLQRGIPGEHFRRAALEDSPLPRFRRLQGAPAYVEGWGLYAASLGEELGAYPDEAAKAQWWALQMRCLAGLVVDTGIHGLSWTRDKALDYLRTQLLLDEIDAQALIDQIAAAPADATACEVGALKFKELKARAQQALGARFDSREYHRLILQGGVLPLDDLDVRVKGWLEASRETH